MSCGLYLLPLNNSDSVTLVRHPDNIILILQVKTQRHRKIMECGSVISTQWCKCHCGLHIVNIDLVLNFAMLLPPQLNNFSTSDLI